MALLSGIHPVAEALRAGNPHRTHRDRAGGRRSAPAGDHRPGAARQRAGTLRAAFVAGPPGQLRGPSGCDRPGRGAQVCRPGFRRLERDAGRTRWRGRSAQSGRGDPHGPCGGRRRHHHSGAARGRHHGRGGQGGGRRLEHLPVVRVTNINRTLEDLKDRGMWIYGLDERGTEAYDQVDYAAKSVLVLGAKAAGCTNRCARSATYWCAFRWPAKSPR